MWFDLSWLWCTLAKGICWSFFFRVHPFMLCIILAAGRGEERVHGERMKEIVGACSGRGMHPSMLEKPA